MENKLKKERVIFFATTLQLLFKVLFDTASRYLEKWFYFYRFPNEPIFLFSIYKDDNICS